MARDETYLVPGEGAYISAGDCLEALETDFGKEMGRAMVIACDGAIRADSSNTPSVVVCPIDLDQHVLFWGDTKKYPHLKEVFFKICETFSIDLRH